MNLANRIRYYIPSTAHEAVMHYLSGHEVELKVKKARSSKYGDYRAPSGVGYPHRISINENLNPYAFLITLVHEIAHLKTWELHRGKVRPHGKEWKNSFRQLMSPLMSERIFPENVLIKLKTYMADPKASSCSDINLMRMLREYDSQNDRHVLEDIPPNSKFTINHKRVFIKGEKLRKRFKCKEVQSHRHYLINPLAEVVIVEK